MLLILLALIGGVQTEQDHTLPHMQKFGYAQTKDHLVLMMYFAGPAGQVALIDTKDRSVRRVDKAKAGYFYPTPLTLDTSFVLLDTLLKKIIWVHDNADIGDTVHFRDVAPELESWRIVAASVHRRREWLLTLEGLDRKTYKVLRFNPVTGAMQSLFGGLADAPDRWYSIDHAVLRISPQTGEIALVADDGKLLKQLRRPREPLMPSKKPKWMHNLKPLSRMSQVVFGEKTAVVFYDFKNDDPDDLALSSLVISSEGTTEAPLLLLGQHDQNRLQIDWRTYELAWAVGEP